MKSKLNRKNSRPDFIALRVPIMWWALRGKLACNLQKLSRHFLGTNGRMIVEDSHKEMYWEPK